MHTKMNKSNIKCCLLIFKTFSLYVELGFKPLYRIQRYYFFRYNLYTSANYFAFLLFFFASGIFLMPFCSAVRVPFCFSASSMYGIYVHYLSTSKESRILPHLIYTTYISRDFHNSSFSSCFPSEAPACLLPASGDVIRTVHHQTAILAICCFRVGGYNPRRARKI